MHQPTPATDLNQVFAALSDPTRRGMLERLAEGETNISTLAQPYAISQPAASKHLRVLENAGLIQRSRQGREHRIRIDPRPIEQARTWISTYARFWRQQFQAVDDFLKKHSDSTSPKMPKPSTPKETAP